MSDARMSPSEMEELVNNSVRNLGRLRDEEAQAKSEIADMLKQLKESERWQTHSAILAETQERIGELEAGLRGLAIEHFKQTGNKTAHQAVKVRVIERPIYNHKEAESWARENLPEALKFDKKTFEKYIKGVRSVKPLPFVTFKKELQPTIAPDLSPYISSSDY
jgi:hypothetical protein